MELVSIVIATFNGSQEIESTIKSAIHQDYENTEIIIIDGLSTDGTQEKISAFKRHIAHFSSEKDKGIGEAWNKGLAKCSGQYIAILNCGDSWPVEFISCHMHSLRETVDTIQYGTTYMTSNGSVVTCINKEFDPTRLTDGFGFIHTSVMTSRAVYDKVGQFDMTKRIAIDSDWMLRALRLDLKFKKVPAHNFMATGGVSSRHWLKGQLEYLDALVSHGYLERIHLKLKIKKWLQSHYLRLGFNKYKSRAKMQAALCAVAALNLFNRWMPFHSPRNLALLFFGLKRAPKAVVHQGVRFMARGRFSVGDGSIINRGTLLDNRSEIIIGNHVSIAHDCRIYTTGHDYQAPDFGVQTSPVRVDDHAVLFAGAVVMPGVHIGRGAVVLPFSVVTKDVAPLSVVGGAPAAIRAQRKNVLNYHLDYNYWFAN